MIDKNDLMTKEFIDLNSIINNSQKRLVQLNFGKKQTTIDPKFGFITRIYFNKNGKEYEGNQKELVSNLVNKIETAKTMKLNAQKVQSYILNLNVIYEANIGQYGVYCNGKDLFIDKEKIEQYNETQQKIILFSAMVFPLLDVYDMAPKGYNGQAGEYEKCTVVLMCKHLGFGNCKPKYAISTRISSNKKIENLEIKLPSIEHRNETLLNLINTPNPFFEVLVNEYIEGNPNKRLIYVKQHFLKMNQGNHFYTEEKKSTLYINENTIMDKKDNEIQQHINKKLFDLIVNPPYKYFKIIFAENLVNDNNKYFIHLMKQHQGPYIDKNETFVLLDGYKIISTDKKHPEIQNHISKRLFEVINDPSQKYFEIKTNEPLFTNPNKRVVKLKVKNYNPYLDCDEATLFMDNKTMLNNKDKDVNDYILATNVMNTLCG